MYHIMEKIDAMTPWHSVTTREDEMTARMTAYRFGKEREEGAKYPKYSVNGMEY